MLWASAHLPLIMGYVLAAGALSKMVHLIFSPPISIDYPAKSTYFSILPKLISRSSQVVCTDVSGLDSHDLTHFYENKSEEHLPEGLRWFYCVGLALALANMGKLYLPSANHSA